MSWLIDGIEWNLPCTVERTAEIQASEISGLLLDKTYFNDVLATYMKYDLRIEVPFGREDEYSLLYDKFLIAPVGSHSFILPYQSGYIEVSGRIESVSDVYVRHTTTVPVEQEGGGISYEKKESIHWKGIQFSVIGTHPTKKVIAVSENEVQYENTFVDDSDEEYEKIVTFGIGDFPTQSDVSVGEAYIYGIEGWEVLPDADDYEF